MSIEKSSKLFRPNGDTQNEAPNHLNKNCISKFIYKYIELNAKPNNYGNPENVSFDIMKSYPSVIEEYKDIKFDLILIDGRFRVLCFFTLSNI